MRYPLTFPNTPMGAPFQFLQLSSAVLIKPYRFFYNPTECRGKTPIHYLLFYNQHRQKRSYNENNYPGPHLTRLKTTTKTAAE